MTIKDKVALVTGAGHGIGAAIAERLAKQGARVAITYRNDEAGATELIKKCEAEGAEIKAYHVVFENDSIIGRIINVEAGFTLLDS